MELSCGVIVINQHKEILLGHSTGNSFWDIPKGRCNENEEHIDCAIRELLEETNISISKDNLTSLGKHNYIKNKKELILFSTTVISTQKENDHYINNTKILCTSYFINRFNQNVPEFNDFKWVKKEDIQIFCTKNMTNTLLNLL